MTNSFILGVTSLLAVNSTEIKENLKTSDDDVCRITVTMSVPDGFGGHVGFSASAGNMFTSCEEARQRAMRKLLDNIFDIMGGM